MTVFIVGAGGYIGSAVAREFLTLGHQVLGLFRNPESKRVFEYAGGRSVVGTMECPESWRAAAEEADVMIQAAYSPSSMFAELDLRTIQTMKDIAGNSPDAPRILYTSGTWVYGNINLGFAAREPKRNPFSIVADRPAVEDFVLDSAGVVYGRNGGVPGSWSGSLARSGEFTVIGTGENCWSMVHIDDLARGYRLAAEHGHPGSSYDFVDDGGYTVGRMSQALVDSVGGGRFRYQSLDDARRTMGAAADTLAVDQWISSQKAREELGWQPEYPTFMHFAGQILTGTAARNGI